MSKEVDREMAEAGSRFESEVRAAMRERGISTLAELERKTGIKRRSWEDWFAGIHAPRRGSLSRAEGALRRTPDSLLGVWEGNGHRRRRISTDPNLAALERIATALERLLEEGVQALPPQRRADDRQALEAWGGEERRRLETQQPRPTAGPPRQRSEP